MANPGPVVGFVEVVEFGGSDGKSSCAVAAELLDLDGVDRYDNTIKVNTICSFAMLTLLTTAMLNANSVEIRKTSPDPDQPTWFGAAIYGGPQSE
ncbi:hypothetical protein PHO31112_05325 [Pandoraea horticolens]|uniref:Uncharacterized protein n=1 Tax=Pandoraea horticolens TaxID=2508298 RepID=A0A5E4ZE67_9BURK|nr:hypothetical protein [Pandoraea horticolens]VVE58473.1 hypothetical protein PHO31112_05325 [Pandoraea horticolens]